MTIGRTNAVIGGSSGAVLVVTLDNGESGVTVTATNGTDSFTGTSNASGVATLTVAPGYDYTVYADSSWGMVHVDAIGASITLKVQFRGIVGCVIDESVADPSSRVSYPQTLSTGQGTYTNLAYGATPMSGASTLSMGSWGSGNLLKFIEDIKPVSFDGTTWTDLNKTDETSWPSTQGTDCFTEFPHRWLSITKSGSTITIAFSGSALAPDSTFQDYAFLGADGTTKRMNFHLGCYTTSGSVSGVYSKPGVKGANMQFNKFWVGASARGAEYDCLPFAQWTYLQALFLVLYKSTNCQTAHSYGYVNGTSAQSSSTISYGNNYGMYGSTSNTMQNAFFWLHNLWGNESQAIASVFFRKGSTKTYYYILSAMSRSSNWDNNSWNSSSNPAYQASLGISTGITNTSSGYFTTAGGTNESGFLPITSGGSDTTYYSDDTTLSANSGYANFIMVGGWSNGKNSDGIFFVNKMASHGSGDFTSRLAYRGGHNYS